MSPKRLMIVGLFSSVSGAALACPVCGGGGANAGAYLDMTIFLSLLPLTILGGFAGMFWYLHNLGNK